MQRQREVERGDPQAAGREVRGEQLGGGAARKRQPPADGGASEASAAFAQLDDPARRRPSAAARDDDSSVPPGSGVDRCSVHRSRRAQARRAWWPLVLTTSRSPARRCAGRPRNMSCTSAAAALGDEQAHLVALGGRRRSPRSRGGERERARGARRGAPSSSSPARACSGRSAGRPRSGRAGRARAPRAAGGRRCPRPGTPPGAGACSCRRGRPRRCGSSGCSAARIAVSCSSAAFDGAVAAPALVGLDRGVGGDVDEHRAGQRELDQRQRREHVDAVDAARARRAGSRRARGCGLGPSSEALLTSRSIPPPAAATSASRWLGSDTSPGSATTPRASSRRRPRAAPPRGRRSRAASRARRGHGQSASPRPREAPVTMAVGMPIEARRRAAAPPSGIGPRTLGLTRPCADGVQRGLRAVGRGRAWPGCGRRGS